jgi:hypothetical protein
MYAASALTRIGVLLTTTLGRGPSSSLRSATREHKGSATSHLLRSRDRLDCYNYPRDQYLYGLDIVTANWQAAPLFELFMRIRAASICSSARC